MRKLTAILLMFAFAQLFSVPPVHAQQVVYARFIRSAAPSLPVFADYPTCGFSTSCTDTVAAGDLVVMMGSAIIQGNITSYAVSSSPSATWNCLPLLGSSSELCWAIMVSSGSTTFTMTPTPSATYATIQIMHYTGGTGHTAQTNASAIGSGTTGLFSTTTPTLTVVFAAGACLTAWARAP